MKTRIYLASTSPRRSELLKQVGISFSLLPPHTDEKEKRGESPSQMVRRLAEEKAEAVFPQIKNNRVPSLVISADTTVVAPDSSKILGKPRNLADARRMLKLLNGKTHVVLTGYCLLHWKAGMRRPQIFSRVVQTRVKMKKLSPHSLERYLETGESMDKAGAYAAQGYGMGLIERISGSYTNVVGLPVSQLLSDLESRFGFQSF